MESTLMILDNDTNLLEQYGSPAAAVQSCYS